MIPASFNYTKASSVEEAVQLLSSNPEAKVIAGGHSLLPSMKLRLSAPETIVDIGGIPGLSGFSDLGEYISIGSGATHAEIAGSKIVMENVPMLSEAAGMIGDPMVRNRGTIGGNLAHADPASDLPAVVLAADATIVAIGSGGEKTYAASEFFQGLFMTPLGADEIITEIRIPKTDANKNSAYEKFSQPASRYAIVGCAAAIGGNGNIEGARIAFNGLASAAFRDGGVESSLEGSDKSDANISAACDQAGANVDALGDISASAEYRIHLAKVMARRAVARAVAGS